MPTLEKIVRPFASQDYAPPVRSIADAKVPEPTKFHIGKGSGRTVGESFSSSARWYYDQKSQEVGVRRRGP